MKILLDDLETHAAARLPAMMRTPIWGRVRTSPRRLAADHAEDPLLAGGGLTCGAHAGIMDDCLNDPHVLNQRCGD
jgi:hypothetical protein